MESMIAGLSAVLGMQRFSLQRRRGKCVFVRPAGIPDLYERLELMPFDEGVGFLIAGSVAVVERSELDYLGLFSRGGIPEFSTDSERGEVHFDVDKQWLLWRDRLASGVSQSLLRIRDIEGAKLLAETAEARKVASVVYEQFSSAVGNPIALDEEERLAVGAVLKQPLVCVGMDSRLCELAVSVLVHSGCESVLAMAAREGVAPLESSILRRKRRLEVHRDGVWCIRILADRLWRSFHASR